MIKNMDNVDRIVVTRMIQFVEDHRNGYGPRVDGTEERILNAFCSMARRALGLPPEYNDEEQNEDPSLDEQELVGAIGYAWQIISPEWFGWCQPGNKYYPTDIDQATIDAKAHDWNERYESYECVDCRWDTEWC